MDWLSKDSNRKSAFFFETQLKTWAERQGFVYLNQLTAAELTKFRGQWGNGPQTTRRTWEHCGNIVVYLRINGLVQPTSERMPTKREFSLV